MTTPFIQILHQDDDLLVVSKPGGMLVHRDMHSRTYEPLLMNTTAAQTGQYIYPVHRLDRNTSGIVAFALSPEMARNLQEILKDQETRKEYLTLVRGDPPDVFKSDRPLQNHNGEPRPAHSEFQTIERFSRCAMLRVRITTGRYHQIRRHLSHLAHQILGDTTHGKGRINREFRERYGLPRMFLHAERLCMAHPRDGSMLDLHDPLAPELDAVRKKLRDEDAAQLSE